MKTNAVRELDRLGVQYELREYVVDPDDLTAGTVAAKIGMPAGQVFKTLVAEGERTGVLLAVVPGDAELDLKALARLSENRRTALMPVKDVGPDRLHSRRRHGAGAEEALPGVCRFEHPNVRSNFGFGRNARAANRAGAG